MISKYRLKKAGGSRKQTSLCCVMPAAVNNTRQGGPEPGVQRLLKSLDQISSRGTGKEKDLMFLRGMFQSQDLQALLQVHHKVSSQEHLDLKPMARNSFQIAAQVYDELRTHPLTSEVRQLLDLLLSPHFKALLTAQDKVACQDYVPQLPSIPHEVDEDENRAVKIVRIMRKNDPLGATIRLNEETGMIYVARVMMGGAADRSGSIHVGDEVHEVNGINVRGRDPDDVVQILAAAQGPITLKLVPSNVDSKIYRESRVRMRAHFNYDPFKDTLIPCREAGLPFKKGDILHIVDQTDLNWWQARREGDKNMRAGLIPGKQLQERKEAMRRTVGTLDGGLYRERENKGIRSSTMNGSLDGRKARKTKKIMYQSENSSDFDNAEIITYEEVEKYYPESGRYRPIVLIGPPGAGRNELKRRLITSNPEHFSATIPHTSRSKKPSEVDGKEYYFVSRTEMDRRIAERRFVEYGEYKGNLYGTSIESITSALNAGKVCVLTPHPQALKMLRSAELKPYVIFIKPPSIERLRDTRLVPTTKGNTDNGMIQKTFSDEELHEMILNASKIEENYSHFFDKTIVNDELTTVFTELCAAVYRIEHEPQWVPISWVR
ncbi:MAGUK p55 subfamily member 7 isoform X2 [Lingula anatina]|uniref:MAGUK p55 subfamily member 7 isoform X2 n=1 Tax=Lingula anatina TaxID=7574 RepID=A0A1S3K8K9_LINAN|nr:MAGUK p55 subfamily member 7 isoform X2 [Lingula anatina]|eukprot:XP_013418779.1 MAGUK p55 subfamily member 7 isoform X2 [Lingula anatina]